MKYAMYVTRRYILTGICKFAAVLATKVKTVFTFNFLAKTLNARDILLCREAKYCMQRTVTWQQKAQKCILAHHAYEQEMKKEKEVVNKKGNKK
jgi:hypothetical protein